MSVRAVASQTITWPVSSPSRQPARQRSRVGIWLRAGDDASFWPAARSAIRPGTSSSTCSRQERKGDGSVYQAPASHPGWQPRRHCGGCPRWRPTGWSFAGPTLPTAGAPSSTLPSPPLMRWSAGSTVRLCSRIDERSAIQSEVLPCASTWDDRSPPYPLRPF